MIILYCYDSKGVFAGTLEVDEMSAMPCGALTPPPETVGNEVAQIQNGEWTILPERPPTDLAPIKAAKNQEINLWRAQANQTTFPHLGKLVACDALSRSDIDAVANSIALTGAFPDSFPMAWKAADNSYIMLPTIAAFKDMHKSMTTQGTINFGKSQQLKATLAAATTEAQVAEIVWS